jgi:hypothetical protein
MKYLFSFFISFVCVTGFSQTPQEIVDLAASNLAVCRNEFKMPKGDTVTTITAGLIINGKYFVTCYHESFVPGGKLIDRMVFFNIAKTKEKKDSVLVDIHYKPTKNQYDFQKHKYDSTDHCTDILVYKLKRQVRIKKYVFANNYFNEGDSVYAVGMQMIKNQKSADPAFSISRITYKTIEKEDWECYHITYIGRIYHGFSGAALYNKKGEIIGLNLFGSDNLNDELKRDIISFYESKYITSDTYNRIIEGYKKGLVLFSAIDIQYVLNHYLKGYL